MKCMVGGVMVCIEVGIRVMLKLVLISCNWLVLCDSVCVGCG